MATAQSQSIYHQHHFHLLDKALVWGSGIAGVALFAGLCWPMIAPDDPLAPLSLTLVRQPVLPLLACLLFGIALAALTTLLAGRSITEIGAVAVGMGLAAASVRGAAASYLLILKAGDGDHFTGGLGASLALESVGWFVVIAGAAAVSARLIHRSIAWRGHEQAPVHEPILCAAGDLPAVGMRIDPNSAAARTTVSAGVCHTLLAACIAVVMIKLLSSGLSNRSIQHGQSLFIVAAAFWVAVHLAYRMFPVRSPLWCLLSVPIAAIAGYLWAAFADGAATPVNIPAQPILRILPVQLIGAGSATVLLTSCTLHRLGLPRPDGAPGSKPASTERARG